MHVLGQLRKGGCEGQEVKQSEANTDEGPQRRLGDLGVTSLLKNRGEMAAGILMISRPSQRDYPSRLLYGRTNQSSCSDSKSQKGKGRCRQRLLGYVNRCAQKWSPENLVEKQEEHETRF